MLSSMRALGTTVVGCQPGGGSSCVGKGLVRGVGAEPKAGNQENMLTGRLILLSKCSWSCPVHSFSGRQNSFHVGIQNFIFG